MELPSSKTSTVLLLSAVPEITNVLSLVMPSAEPLSVLTPVTLGAAGAVVSIVKLKVLDAALVLAAASVAVAVIDVVPTEKKSPDTAL